MNSTCRRPAASCAGLGRPGQQRVQGGAQRGGLLPDLGPHRGGQRITVTDTPSHPRSRSRRSAGHHPARPGRRPAPGPAGPGPGRPIRSAGIRVAAATTAARAGAGGHAGRRAPAAGQPGRPRGSRGQFARRSQAGAVAPGQHGAHHVRHGPVHPQRRAGQGAVGAARRLAVAGRQHDRLAAEQVLARRHARARGGVGDQADPARARPRTRPAQATGAHMVQVGDQAAGQPGVGQRLADHARLPVVQRALRVEQVGDHPGAPAPAAAATWPAVASLCPTLTSTPGRGQLADGGHPAVHLRRQRDQPEHALPRSQQLTDGRRAGRDDPVRVVRTAPGGRDERPLQVHAEHPRAAVRQPPGEPGRAAQRRGRARQRGAVTNVGRNAVHPGLRQARGHRRPAVRVRGHQLDAEVPVDLEVHQARDEHPGVSARSGWPGAAGPGRPR